MICTGCDSCDAAGETGNLHGHKALGGCTIAKLAAGICAPALNASIDKGTGVSGITRDRSDTIRETCNLHRNSAVGSGIVAKLAIRI